MQTRIAANAKPITNARLLNEHKPVWGVLANWMLLAVWHVVGPITRMYGIIVKKRKRTLLNSCGSVPTVPVASARGCMWKHTVLPLTVFSGNRLLWSFGLSVRAKLLLRRPEESRRFLLTAHRSGSIWTRDSVRVVAGAGQAAPFARKREPICASLQNWLVCCRITFVIVITKLLVRENGPTFAFARAAKVYCSLRGGPLRNNLTCWT